MKKRLLASALILCLVFALAACGGTPASSTPAASTPAESTPAESTPAEPTGGAPDRDMVVATSADARTMDPHKITDTNAISMASTIYETLVAFDDNQELIPMLAEKWEGTDDGLSYTFTLRQGVTFHDGEVWNAAAFMANYDRAMSMEGSRAYARASTWKSVETPDDNTVVINLNEPHSSFLNQLTQFRIISPQAIDEYGTDGFERAGVGTGPFKFVSRQEGDNLVVEPYADYWGDKPDVDTLTFRVVPEDGSRVAMLQTGEADAIYPVPAQQAATLEAEEDVTLVTRPSNIIRYVTLNVNVPELSDVRVRQAMNYAIDKQAYITTVFNGYAVEVNSCYPDTVSYHHANEPYTFNLDKAKELMADAGYEDGFKITMWGDNITNEQVGMQFVAQQLAQIGIEVEVLPMDPNIQEEMRNVPEEEATINTWYVNWSSSSFDADGSMRALLYSTNIPPTSANTAYWKNAEFDETLDAARAATDPAELTELYAKCQELVWEECPWLFLGSDEIRYGAKTYVENVSVRPDGSVYLGTVALK